jgi:hypothetical protein
MGERKYSSTILDLGARLICVFSFTSRPVPPHSPWEIAHGTDWVGGWVGSRMGLGALPGIELHPTIP